MLLTKPSFYYLVFTKFLIVSIFFITIYNIKRFKKLSPEMLIKMISLFGILVGIHGLQHLGLEVTYNYNPMEQILLVIVYCLLFISYFLLAVIYW
jgi:hypothetical protein